MTDHIWSAVSIIFFTVIGTSITAGCHEVMTDDVYISTILFEVCLEVSRPRSTVPSATGTAAVMVAAVGTGRRLRRVSSLVVKDGGPRQRRGSHVHGQAPWGVYHRVAPRHCSRRRGRGQNLRRPLVLAVFGGALHDVGHH